MNSATAESTNPLSHIIAHLEFATREAILQEIVTVWSEHQDQVRFESFSRRLSELRYARSDADFQRQVCDLVLWFGHEQPYVDSRESHKVSGVLLESDLLKTASSFIHALSDPARLWRVHVQPGNNRIQISDPRLGWHGRDVAWTKVHEFCTRLDTDLKYAKWIVGVYIRDADGEPYRVNWINRDTNDMACESPRGAYSVRSLHEWRERWLR